MNITPNYQRGDLVMVVSEPHISINGYVTTPEPYMARIVSAPMEEIGVPFYWTLPQAETIVRIPDLTYASRIRELVGTDIIRELAK